MRLIAARLLEAGGGQGRDVLVEPPVHKDAFRVEDLLYIYIYIYIYIYMCVCVCINLFCITWLGVI